MMSACYYVNTVTCDNCRPRLVTTTGTMGYCPVCGQSYLGAHACSRTYYPALPVQLPPIVPKPLPTRQPSDCPHCWCDDDLTVNGKPHQGCCMCATRRMKA